MDRAGEYLRTVTKGDSVMLVCGDIVNSLYAHRVTAALETAGYRVARFVYPHGEQSKNPETYLALLNAMAEQGITRSDTVLALGGGVTGDLAGFAAATYQRGIRYVQMPTTLLAPVDSSVGGKTAIDLPAGKNLAGAFWQPSLVLCDTDTLNTLPADIFRDGCAEVIKYGVLYDPDLFSYLEETGLNFDREAVITRCIELKRDVVTEDEFDTGARMKLNLGHTVGHGIEALSRFQISHGEAVAIGMAIISRASGCRDSGRIVNILKKFRLPTETEFSAQELNSHMLSDKKRSGGTVNLIVPISVGNCVILPISVENLQSYIQAGL